MASTKPYDGLTEKEKDNMLDLIFQRVPLEEFEVGGMPLIHRIKLRKCHTLLVNNLDTLPVTDYLFQEGILTSEDKNNIKLPVNTPEDRNRILLEKLPTKGPKAFVKLLQALRENQADWVVDELDKLYVEVSDLDVTVTPVRKAALPPTTTTVTPTVTIPPTTTTVTPTVTIPRTTTTVTPIVTKARTTTTVTPTVTKARTTTTTPTTTPAATVRPVVPSKPSLSSLAQPLGEHTVGVINFTKGVVKQFNCKAKTWENTDISIHQDLWQKNLEWAYRVCAEGDGKVYVLNTRDMVLHCLDVASRQWAEKRQVDTPYRAKWAAMTYVNGRLYVSGGRSLDGNEQDTMVSVIVARGGNSPVSVQQEPDMLYRRTGHGMAGVGGRVLVCGGVGDNDRLANSEVFDLGTRTWSRIADMPEASWSFGLIPTATAVFVLGGITKYIGVSPTLSDTVSVFDWQRRQWTSLPRLPMPLSNIQAAYRGGSLWLLAAVTEERKNNPGRSFADRLECVLEYNVTQQTWVAHHNTPDVGTDGRFAYTFPL